MSYILRYVFLEDRWEKQLADVIKLCKKVGIEEVFALEQSHQIIMVPFLREKHARMAEIYCRIADALRKEGIIFSVDIASLVGHTGVALPTPPPFQEFTAASLRVSPWNFCILDERWQEFAADVCAMYAKSRPDKLFVDDDFRSMNHTERFGCFCPLHVKETARRAGVELTAEQLVKIVAGPTEEDRRIRNRWQEATFSGQLAAARKIRAAVEAVSPETRVGLMTSSEVANSFQGRDIKKLLREFAGPEKRPMCRPHGGSYSDAIHDRIFHMHQATALSMSAMAPETQVFSEVENYPHTRYLKSLHVTRLQMELHALAGVDEFTLNVYDYLATPFDLEPEMGELLASVKRRLEHIQQARRGKALCGLALPWKADTVAKLPSPRGKLDDLHPTRELDLYLPQCGIPVQFASGKASAIFGNVIQSFDDDEVRRMLAGGLMIDGTALQWLCERGFKELLGCEIVGAFEGPTVERMEENAFSGYFSGVLLPTNWYRTKRNGVLPAKLKPAPGAQVISTLLDDELRPLGPAVVLFENALGGRVAVFGVPFTNAAWLHRGRAYQVAKVADWLMHGLPVWVENTPNVGPIYYEDEATGEGLLGVVNAGLDRVRVQLRPALRLADLFTGEAPGEIDLDPLSVRFFRTLR